MSTVRKQLLPYRPAHFLTRIVRQPVVSHTTRLSPAFRFLFAHPPTTLCLFGVLVKPRTVGSDRLDLFVNAEHLVPTALY